MNLNTVFYLTKVACKLYQIKKKGSKRNPITLSEWKFQREAKKTLDEFREAFYFISNNEASD